MPLNDENRGLNADGSRSEDYCMYCYKNGAFTQDFTMGQMIEFCLQFLDQWNTQAGCNLTPIQAKEQMFRYFPRLKRWKEKDERTLAEKATHLLAQCENVTVASIDANGYPRPVQMSKAGLCYDHYGDGVALRGTVEVITDDAIRKEMWQDWFVHHFPGGPGDPNYVLLHFVGKEATFWINGEFSHSNIPLEQESVDM